MGVYFSSIQKVNSSMMIATCLPYLPIFIKIQLEQIWLSIWKIGHIQVIENWQVIIKVLM